MGANESANVKVNFHRSNCFYFGDEKISGTVSFQNLKPTLTPEEIFLELIGEIGYTAKETPWHHDTSGRLRQVSRIEHHHVHFLSQRVSVGGSNHEQVCTNLKYD
jgi:hypothetical protein